MLKRIAACFFKLIMLLPLSFSVFAAAETWTLDPTHSYVLWKIEHLGFSSQVGKFYVNGTVTLDQDNPKNSSVKATVKVADVVTGLPELDKHLKSKLFFDVEKFPTATFISNKVDVTSKTTAKVEGTLTLHGVSKPITLNVVMNKEGKNPINDKLTTGFSAVTEIKRSDFGIRTFLPDLGDEVVIEIGAEANKK